MDFDVVSLLDPCLNDPFSKSANVFKDEAYIAHQDYDMELFDSISHTQSNMESLADAWREDASSDSGIDCIQTKVEPPSPSFFSDSPPHFQDRDMVSTIEFDIDGKIEGLDCMLDECYQGNDNFLRDVCLNGDKTMMMEADMDVLLSQLGQPSSAAEEVISEFFSNDNLFQAFSSDDMKGIITSSMPSTPSYISEPPFVQPSLPRDGGGSPSSKPIGGTGQTGTTIIVIQPSTGGQRSPPAAPVPPRKPNDPVRVVCSKVQIQPKPEAESFSSSMNYNGVNFQLAQQHQPQTTGSTPSKLNFFIQSPSNSDLLDSPSSKPNNKRVATKRIMPSDGLALYDDIESKAIKRQQRMIKNRESASLSRKRKKEYLQCLEDKLRLVSDENLRLKMENSALKQRLCSLQSENDALKTTKKLPVKPGALLAVCLLLVFNGSSILFNQGNILSSGNTSLPPLPLAPPQDSSFQSIKRVGRNLQEYVPPYPNQLHMSIDLFGFSRGKNHSIENNDIQICSHNFVNSTEAMRMVNELKGWADNHKVVLRRRRDMETDKMSMKNKKDNSTSEGHKSFQFHTPNFPRKDFASNVVGGQLKRHPQMNSQDFLRRRKDGKAELLRRPRGHDVKVYDRPNNWWRVYDDFLDSIKRRNDTFYIVSFHNDHILLPAMAHNKSMRPKMSVFMPAQNINDPTSSHLSDGMSMMKIDCEVTATNLIHLDRSGTPGHILGNFSDILRPLNRHGEESNFTSGETDSKENEGEVNNDDGAGDDDPLSSKGESLARINLDGRNKRISGPLPGSKFHGYDHDLQQVKHNGDHKRRECNERNHRNE